MSNPKTRQRIPVIPFNEPVVASSSSSGGAFHEANVRATARGDADSLDYERPGFDRAYEVHMDRSTDEAPSALEMAKLGRARCAEVYEDEWDKILADGDECDHAEWGPACPFCNAPAMAIAAGKPGRKYLVIRYDVTDLSDFQVETLAGEALVQAEASDHDESPCGEGDCEHCSGGDREKCERRMVNHPDVEAERVDVLAWNEVITCS